MAKRPVIDSADIAERMAECPETTSDGVARPLHESGAHAVATAFLTPAQREEYDALRVLVKDVARYRLPGATSEHSDFYDENGLPV
ncbi:hypothetical protein [Methylobacterium sp. 17Sr1-1]|uniref:hypothetical protein n=1 Tax=Methylobacterium sp. 17Sr1-1 TaxID=2202826 RepID=UPI000D6FBE40|nr:hypothetical protein [Methylobacterium sp. 17Sr1-1]AWN53150.1 hypothetical protein DK412_17220 [Methylobacterium sp. 17Sr1-1]